MMAPMAEHPIIVHSLKEARAAVAVAAEFGVPVTLASAPEAAGSLGALWLLALVTLVAAVGTGSGQRG